MRWLGGGGQLPSHSLLCASAQGPGIQPSPLRPHPSGSGHTLTRRGLPGLPSSASCLASVISPRDVLAASGHAEPMLTSLLPTAQG